MLREFQELHLGRLHTCGERRQGGTQDLERIGMSVAPGQALCCEIAFQQLWWWRDHQAHPIPPPAMTLDTFN